jgi:hypothetical protein
VEFTAQRVADLLDDVMEVATIVPPKYDWVLIGCLVDGSFDGIFSALWEGLRCGHDYY